ncbi:hypothetical protein C8R44DRAFT_639037 [Mycena epipterygia]|nr:hypothetical protein C8R44DRAFT_639037 [Mycena epipterygia]
MEGIRIFVGFLLDIWHGILNEISQAGLFSASLTAFLIESYKTLNRDPGDITVHLLSQISQQLAASANGSSFSIPPA